MAPQDQSIIINPVTHSQEEDLQATIHLFQTYATSLGIDLTFQDFSTEMAGMPGKYSPEEGGALFLARKSDSRQPVGCVELRSLSLEEGTCEMKRLYVDPAGRGLGVGKALVGAVVQEAKRLGYAAMLLDTLKSMGAARGLYRSLGFVECEGYYETPLREETVFLRLEL